MILLAVFGLYSVLSPETRSNLGDIALIASVIIGGITAIVLFFKNVEWPWKVIRYIWQFPFGKEISYPDGVKTVVRMTPMVRLKRAVQEANGPAMERLREHLAAELILSSQEMTIALGAAQRSNTDEHAAAIKAIHGLSGRVDSLDGAVAGLSERLSAVEAALMNAK